MFGRQVLHYQVALLQMGAAIVHMAFFTAAQSVQHDVFVPLLQNLLTEDKTGFSRIESRQTETECAVACEEEIMCLRFSFTSADGLCRMGNAATVSGQKLRKRIVWDCPASSGYTLYVDSNLALCLKIVMTLTEQGPAKADCKTSTGHLLLVESGKMHEFLKKFLPIGASIWIDGQEDGVNGEFYTWNDKPLGWASWDGTNPDGDSRNCLNIDARYTGTKFLFRDGGCSIKLRYVCQID